MPYRCCVPNCNGNYKGGPKVSLFSFPTDEDLRMKWISSIKKKDFTLNVNRKVCELHFVSEDIRRVMSYYDERTDRLLTARLCIPVLHKGAIPSLFPVAPEETISKENSTKSRFCGEIEGVKKKSSKGQQCHKKVTIFTRIESPEEILASYHYQKDDTKRKLLESKKYEMEDVIFANTDVSDNYQNRKEEDTIFSRSESPESVQYQKEETILTKKQLTENYHYQNEEGTKCAERKPPKRQYLKENAIFTKGEPSENLRYQKENIITKRQLPETHQYQNEKGIKRTKRKPPKKQCQKENAIFTKRKPSENHQYQREDTILTKRKSPERHHYQKEEAIFTNIEAQENHQFQKEFSIFIKSQSSENPKVESTIITTSTNNMTYNLENCQPNKFSSLGDMYDKLKSLDNFWKTEYQDNLVILYHITCMTNPQIDLSVEIDDNFSVKVCVNNIQVDILGEYKVPSCIDNMDSVEELLTHLKNCDRRNHSPNGNPILHFFQILQIISLLRAQ